LPPCHLPLEPPGRRGRLGAGVHHVARLLHHPDAHRRTAVDDDRHADHRAGDPLPRLVGGGRPVDDPDGDHAGDRHRLQPGPAARPGHGVGLMALALANGAVGTAGSEARLERLATLTVRAGLWIVGLTVLLFLALPTLIVVPVSL